MHELLDTVCATQGWVRDGNRITVHLTDGRTQTVALEDWRDPEIGPSQRLVSVVGDASALDAMRMRAALRLNWTFRYGAVAIRGDELVLTDALVGASLEPGELTARIAYLARTADTYEKYVFHTDEH
jgi:hypothetical protein